MTQRTWFLTGATGQVGRELLRRILERSDDQVIGLVRGASDERVAKRKDRLFKDLFGKDYPAEYAARFEALRGDLMNDKLGLDDETWARIARDASRIAHPGASVDFGAKYEDAYRHNVMGTTHMLELATEMQAQGGIDRFAMVSTCYIGGDLDEFKPEDLFAGQNFRNAYEKTKAEAEQLCRDAMERLPIMTFRLSTVVGDSRTGKTATFNVIYWPLRIYSKGWYPWFIGRMDAYSDVVPVNYVADALLHILEQESALGQTFHLAAGPDRCTTNGRVIEMASKYFDQPIPEVIEPETLTDEKKQEIWDSLGPAQRTIITQGMVYLPYFTKNPMFITAATEAALQGTDIECPDVGDYFSVLFEYAARTDWGRRKG